MEKRGLDVVLIFFNESGDESPDVSVGEEVNVAEIFLGKDLCQSYMAHISLPDGASLWRRDAVASSRHHRGDAVGKRLDPSPHPEE